MNFKQQLKGIYLTWVLMIIFHFTVMYFNTDIILNAGSQVFYVIQTILNVITLVVGMYALYVLFSMIRHFGSCLSMMEHGSVIVARKEYNGAQPSELKPGKGILVAVLNAAGLFCVIEWLTGQLMHTEIYVGSEIFENRNQAIMYLCMAVVSVLFIDVVAVFRVLAHMKEKKLLTKRFAALENDINVLSKTEKIADVNNLISGFKKIALNDLIIQKLEEVEKQIDLFNMKKEAFEELFRLKELDWEKQIRESLYETEKALVNNCYNMLFAIKSLEGACLQGASLTVSSDSQNEINRNFADNIKANNIIFNDLNNLFAQTATTYNKVSTATLDVDGTIKAMEMKSAMNNINHTQDTIVSRNINRIISEMNDSKNT